MSTPDLIHRYVEAVRDRDRLKAKSLVARKAGNPGWVEISNQHYEAAALARKLGRELDAALEEPAA